MSTTRELAGCYFTPAECTRAHEIRAYAERPENLRLLDVRLRAETNGGEFAGVRACYSLRLVGDERMRICTMSLPATRGKVPNHIAVAIVTGLFGFVLERGMTKVIDPLSPLVLGFAQPVGPERACRVCGCTDLRACLGGCSWASFDVCSACRRAS